LVTGIQLQVCYAPHFVFWRTKKWSKNNKNLYKNDRKIQMFIPQIYIQQSKKGTGLEKEAS
jgi:hypothetical protein